MLNECLKTNLHGESVVTAQVSSLLIMNANAELHDSSYVGVTLPTGERLPRFSNVPTVETVNVGRRIAELVGSERQGAISGWLTVEMVRIIKGLTALQRALPSVECTSSWRTEHSYRNPYRKGDGIETVIHHRASLIFSKCSRDSFRLLDPQASHLVDRFLPQ